MSTSPDPTPPRAATVQTDSGKIMESAMKARKTEREWSTDIPKTIGLWEIRCEETNLQAARVAITNRGAALYVHDSEIGIYPLKTYHENLINLHWRKLS